MYSRLEGKIKKERRIEKEKDVETKRDTQSELGKNIKREKKVNATE